LGTSFGQPYQADYRVAHNHARTAATRRHLLRYRTSLSCPRSSWTPHRGEKESLESYSEPIPLVVEVWSPSTGRYDARDKLDGYKLRGDLEIWLIDPYAFTLVAHRRQPDGTYTRRDFARGDVVEPVALAGVRIDLEQLFA